MFYFIYIKINILSIINYFYLVESCEFIIKLIFVGGCVPYKSMGPCIVSHTLKNKTFLNFFISPQNKLTRNYYNKIPNESIGPKWEENAVSIKRWKLVRSLNLSSLCGFSWKSGLLLASSFSSLLYILFKSYLYLYTD